MFLFRLLGCTALGALCFAGLSGCIVAEGSIPAVDMSAVVSGQFNHRGMVQVDDEVAQGDIRVHLPTKDEGTLSLGAFANVNLNDDIGDSWFPQGKGGRVTQSEFSAAYSREVGPVTLTGGVLSYVPSDGSEFPNGRRGSTTELFGTVEGDIWGFIPGFTVHYDPDEVDGFYFNASVRRPFTISGRFRADVGGSIAYSSENESDWTYGIEEEGFSDLKGEARVFFDYNDNTTFMVGGAVSTIVDDEIADWFDTLGIEDNNLWGFIGILWSF